jgi:hypothetical protein
VRADSEIIPWSYDRPLEADFGEPYDLGGWVGPGAKQVVINDYLPDGVLYTTPTEIVLSKRGWEKLVQALERKAIVEGDVRAIVETVLRRELTWLRAAGHEV